MIQQFHSWAYYLNKVIMQKVPTPSVFIHYNNQDMETTKVSIGR